MIEGMGRGLVAIGALLLVLGCGVNRKPIDARHAKRTAEIHARYDELQRENAAAWRVPWEQVRRLRDLLVPLDKRGVPERPLLGRFNAVLFACDEGAHAESCRRRAEFAYGEALTTFYGYADVDWVLAERARDPTQHVEALMARSHNERLTAAIARFEQSVLGGLAESRTSIEAARSAELDTAAAQRDLGIAQAEQRRRRRVAAVAQGLQAFGRSMQGASTASTGAAGSVVTSGCSSDFQCGTGRTCVKDNYSARGVCMRAVDEHGVPTFEPPRTDSVGVKAPEPGDCQLGGCPIGFTCDVRSGACIKGGR